MQGNHIICNYLIDLDSVHQPNVCNLVTSADKLILNRPVSWSCVLHELQPVLSGPWFFRTARLHVQAVNCMNGANQIQQYKNSSESGLFQKQFIAESFNHRNVNSMQKLARKLFFVDTQTELFTQRFHLQMRHSNCADETPNTNRTTVGVQKEQPHWQNSWSCFLLGDWDCTSL